MPPSNSVAKSVTAHSGRFSLRITTRSPLLIPQDCICLAVAKTQRCNWAEVMGCHAPLFRVSIARSSLRLTTVKKTSLSVRMFITHQTWLPFGSPHPTQQDVQNRFRNMGQRIVLLAQHPRSHHFVDGAEEAVRRNLL